MTKRIFLTGATGNAGPAAVAELQRRNYEVTALVRGSDAHSGCREVHGCLDRLADLHDEIAAADGIVHLASPRGNTRDSVVFDDILGTGELLDAWSHGNFVYASSQTVYGIPNLPLDESAPVDAQCWYDLGKVANEFQIQMTKAEDDGARGHAISLRMALLFGATYRRRDRQFLPAVYDHCRNGSGFVFDSEEGLEAYGSSYIGDQDFARAVADSLELGVSCPFNVASGFCTWRDLVETVSDALRVQARFVVRPDGLAGPGEYRLPQSRSYVDASALARETGFVPRQGLEELVDSFVAQEQLSEAVARVR